MVCTELTGYWRTRLGSGLERYVLQKTSFGQNHCCFLVSLSRFKSPGKEPLWLILHMPVCPLAGVSWSPGRIWSFQLPWGHESRFIGLNTSQQISFPQIRNLGAIKKEMDAGDVYMEISIWIYVVYIYTVYCAKLIVYDQLICHPVASFSSCSLPLKWI